jgi:gamma-glutamyltranspeptidase/glutathione hydrolase
VHVVAEAMKRAFADRAYWLGDPGFTDVPKGLVAKEYGARLASQILVDRATPVAGHGDTPHTSDFFSGRHTTHFCTADAEGNWVACTATINTTFGSKVIVPGTGIVLNNEMDDFAVAPGVSNFFGLIGSAANAVAAGKRPLSSMSPTLVIKDGKPMYALGGAGGPRIISQVVVELVALLDLQVGVREAAAMPRVHQQWRPDELVLDASMPGVLRRELRAMGHQVKSSRGMGISHLIGRLPNGGFVGAADPRGNGKAAGF